MMGHVRSIRWTKDGWPLVMPERYGAVPKVAITEEELPGNWEHIDLTYKYGEQRTSATMTLAADHTITEGIWKGSTWSYDAAQQILTVNGVELYLQRETDWEASPRTHTIVYAAMPTTRRIGERSPNKHSRSARKLHIETPPLPRKTTPRFMRQWSCFTNQ